MPEPPPCPRRPLLPRGRGPAGPGTEQAEAAGEPGPRCGAQVRSAALGGAPHRPALTWPGTCSTPPRCSGRAWGSGAGRRGRFAPEPQAPPPASFSLSPSSPRSPAAEWPGKVWFGPLLTVFPPGIGLFAPLAPGAIRHDRLLH